MICIIKVIFKYIRKMSVYEQAISSVVDIMYEGGPIICNLYIRGRYL